MSAIDELFERAFQGMKEEFDKGKSVPEENSLVPSTRGGGSVPSVTVPNVRPPSAGRMARKVTEAEQIRQWRMVQIARRTALAIDSASAVAAYAFHTADDMQNAIADSLYGDKQHEPMNELMKMFAEGCLKRGGAGILSFLESYAKRIAEEL